MDSWLSLLYEAKHDGMKSWVALCLPRMAWVALSWLFNSSEQFFLVWKMEMILARSVAWLAECLPSMYEVLGSIPSVA